MICPRCQNELLETAKHGVILDHCPSCGGIWLDRGELAKIIAHMKQVESSLDAEFCPTPERRESYDRHHESRHYEKHHDKPHYKKKSRFEKLFDIFD